MTSILLCIIMRCKISKNKTNPYTISAIAIFFAVSISGFLFYYYCFPTYPAVYAQQQSKDNVNDISKRPNAAVNTTSQEPEPQIAVPSISTKDLNNTIDMQSSGVDDKDVEELFEAEPEDNTETGSENMDNEKMDKQGTKNLEEKETSKQVDRNQQQKKQSSGESASTGSIAEEEEDIKQKPEKGEKQEQADNKEEQEEEKRSDKTGDKDGTESDKGGEQKIEDRDEMEEEEEKETEEKEEEDDELKDKPSDDTPLELPFP